MTSGPPPYPRTPHLWPDAVRPARLVLSAPAVAHWLHEPVVVEEKLDGANVSLWWDDGVQVASRGGVGSMDRAGQLGRLRAWAAQRAEPLQVLLADGSVLYGEWLWLRHGVAYDRLPDWLVALDLWHPEHGFADLSGRDERCARAGLCMPPRLFNGVLGSRKTVLALLRTSEFSTTYPAEGLVLRSHDGRRCKFVAPGFRRREDSSWADGRNHNALTPAGGPPVLSRRGARCDAALRTGRLTPRPR